MLTFLLGLTAFLVGFVVVVAKAPQILLRYAWPIAPFLVNDPEKPNKFYCFTEIEQGQAKVAVRGKQVVGYMVNMPEKSLRRDKGDDKRTVNSAAFADIVNEPADTEVTDLLYWWEGSRWYPAVKHIYDRQKLVFVGIPPWQKLLHRPFRSAHLVEDEKTKEKTIVYKDGTTDHLRAREFARPFFARSIETLEGVKVTLGIEITFETINMFRALFGVDRFELRLDNIVPARIQQFVKRSRIEDVLTAKEDTARAVEDFLIGRNVPELDPSIKPDEGVGGVLARVIWDYGLRAKKAHVFEIEPELSKEDAEALTAKWREARLADAKIEKARGDKEYLKETSEPLRNNPALADIERIRAAASGKGVTTIIERSGQGVSTDPAMLAELQRLRGDSGGAS